MEWNGMFERILVLKRRVVIGWYMIIPYKVKFVWVSCRDLMKTWVKLDEYCKKYDENMKGRSWLERKDEGDAAFIDSISLYFRWGYTLVPRLPYTHENFSLEPYDSTKVSFWVSESTPWRKLLNDHVLTELLVLSIDAWLEGGILLLLLGQPLFILPWC